MRRLAGRRAERVAIDRLVAATRSGRTGTLALERRQGLSAGALRGARALDELMLWPTSIDGYAPDRERQHAREHPYVPTEEKDLIT